jgi:hypothetical protein
MIIKELKRKKDETFWCFWGVQTVFLFDIDVDVVVVVGFFSMLFDFFFFWCDLCKKK